MAAWAVCCSVWNHVGIESSVVLPTAAPVHVNPCPPLPVCRKAASSVVVIDCASAGPAAATLAVESARGATSRT